MNWKDRQTVVHRAVYFQYHRPLHADVRYAIPGVDRAIRDAVHWDVRYVVYWNVDGTMGHDVNRALGQDVFRRIVGEEHP